MFGEEDSRDRLGGIYTAQVGSRLFPVPIVTTSTLDSFLTYVISISGSIFNHVHVLRRRCSTISRARNRCPEIFFGGCCTRSPSSQTQTTRAKIVEASASLRVTGDLGWARMCQNEELNVLSDEEARYRCLREFLCFERCDMDLHNRRTQTARIRVTAGTNTENSVHAYTCRNDPLTANVPPSHRMAIPTPGRHARDTPSRHLRGPSECFNQTPGRVVVWLSGRGDVNTVREKSDHSVG